MIAKYLLILATLIFLVSNCNSTTDKANTEETYSDVSVVGALRNVMQKGDLSDRIYLDSLSNKNGLYGLGPKSNLRGELLIKNGVSYVSQVTSDSTMTVFESYDVSAPFFVSANVVEWEQFELPNHVKTIDELDTFLDELTIEMKRPFAFKLTGNVSSAIIHIQNLPDGSVVSSPADAHQGQVKYPVNNEESEIIGFFSTEHKGVFTHHDSNIHLHLITSDRLKMGHLDELKIGNMVLHLPVK